MLRNAFAVPSGIAAPEATLCPPPLPPTALAACLRAKARSRPFATSSRVPLADTFRMPSVSLTQMGAGDISLDSVAEADAAKMVGLITALPHGVMGMSAEFDGLVETSTNLATLETGLDEFNILTSQRSSSASRQAEITRTVTAVAALAGAEARVEDGYPPWQPDMDSELLDKVVEVLRADPDLGNFRLRISILNGSIRLSGNVDSRSSKQRAENIVSGIKGVVDIQNDLEIE